MIEKKERTAAPFLWGLGSPGKQKCENAASDRSGVFRKSICFPIACQAYPKVLMQAVFQTKGEPD